MTYKLITEGGRSHGARLIDSETGQELRGIRSVSVHVRVDEPVLAEVELVSVSALADIARAKFLIKHPSDGELRAVRRIEFEDGSCYEVVDGRLMQVVDEP